MLWIRLSFQELLKNKGFAFFFILNLSIGLAGFIAIHSLGDSLNRHLDNNLKNILTADLMLSANSPLTPDELMRVDKILGKDKTQARLIRFYTMIKTKDQSRLIGIMAIDENYPLYGDFSLSGNTRKKDIQKNPGVFMTRDTAHAIGLVNVPGRNNALTLGKKSFFIQDFFAQDPDTSLTAFELAPKIYMGIEQLRGTGLIQFGSRIWYSYYYRFNHPSDIPGLKAALLNAFSHTDTGPPRFNIYDSRDVSQRLEKITGYFTGYMGLISVVALFLAGIATAYLFRGYLIKKQKDMAILMSIGARQRDIYFYVSFQLIVLGTLASILAVFISLLLLPVFPIIFKGLIPAHIRLVTDPATVFLAVGMGTAGSLIFCLPVFVRLFGIKPLILLRGTVPQYKKNPLQVMGQAASFLPGVIAFFLVSARVAGSVNDGIIFTGGFAVSLAFLTGIGWFLFSGCRYLSHTRNTTRKIAFRNLYRNKWSSLSCFVTIAMGAFLISIIPQIQKGLQTEIVRPEGFKIPVFFLVDIQDEQKDRFIEFIKQEKAELVHLSPMVRGKILTKNHHPFYDTITKDTEKKSNTRRQGGRRRLEFNFSSRRQLDVSERIIKGSPLTKIPWNFTSQMPFEVSTEASFAERYNLTIGDLIEFDIQGIPMTGKIKNIRKVKWNSFQPNFYLLFQNGVLNDAPKTFLATLSQIAPEHRQALKNKIVDLFPNVSIIDVTQMAGSLLNITDRLSLSIRFMAWLAIAAGLVSIYSIARHEAWKNENQLNLLKILGADVRSIQAITLVEFGFIGFTASLFSILLSLAFSRAISWYFFDSLWQYDLMVSLAILCLTTGTCVATALVASGKVMNSKPAGLLTES